MNGAKSQKRDLLVDFGVPMKVFLSIFVYLRLLCKLMFRQTSLLGSKYSAHIHLIGAKVFPGNATKTRALRFVEQQGKR